MKRLGKSVSVIIALLILVFSVFSVFGFSYYTGDNKNTVFKGFGDIDWGIDVNGGAKIVLSAATTDEASTYADSLQAAAQVIEDRAVKYGLTDYELCVNENSGELTLVVPNSIDSDFTAEEVAVMLTTYGDLTLRGGDANGDILLSSNNIKDSSWFEYTEEGYTYYYVNLSFDDEGTAVMASLTDADTGQYYNQTVAVCLDGAMIASPTVSETLNTGMLSFTSQDFTESKAKLYSAIVSVGTLPIELSAVSLDTQAPVAGDSVADIIFVAGIVALVAIALIMIIRYKLVGVVSVFALLAQFSAVLAVITRFVGDGGTFLLTIPGAVALALSVMLSVMCCVLFGEKIKSELNSGTVLGTAISSAIENRRKTIFDINVILAIVAFVGMFLFGAWNLSFAIFGGNAVSGIYNFCYVLFFGAVLNFITGYFLPQLMLRSLQSFNAFNKPSMFGGAK